MVDLIILSVAAFICGGLVFGLIVDALKGNNVSEKFKTDIVKGVNSGEVQTVIQSLANNGRFICFEPKVLTISCYENRDDKKKKDDPDHMYVLEIVDPVATTNGKNSTPYGAALMLDDQLMLNIFDGVSRGLMQTNYKHNLDYMLTTLQERVGRVNVKV